MLRYNPEIKRLALLLISVCLGFIMLAVIASLLSTNALRNAVANQQAAIVGAVVELYPGAELEVVQQFHSPNQLSIQKGQAILAAYGWEKGQLPAETGLAGNSFRIYLLHTLVLAFILVAGITGVFWYFLHRQYKRIHELTLYTERTAYGADSLDIRDNEEGQLSILKNGIYKMTTMLREQKNILQRDKLHLADSIADISHQLKTPLTSLFVLTDLLQDEPKEDIRTEFITKLRTQLIRMEWLVSSLLKLSKLDAGTVTMKQESYDLRALVDDVLASLSIPLEIKMIETAVEGKSPVSLIGDRNWTREALLNVIKNSIEHTPERGKLHISITDNPLYTRVTISDSGPGIAKKDLPYVFQRFYRGANAGDDSVGIGLAMAHTIIKKQGGDITAHSQEGQGASFVLTFYTSRR